MARTLFVATGFVNLEYAHAEDTMRRARTAVHAAAMRDEWNGWRKAGTENGRPPVRSAGRDW
jgi:hypothetical protein